jgi:predicted small lipoprotein YifL
MARVIAVAALAAAFAGCGTKPLQPPDPQKVREPGRLVPLSDARTGLHFVAPLNWVKRNRARPGIFRIASGVADVSGWSYPRNQKLPHTQPALESARDALVQEAQKRNATFKLTSSAITKVKGWPAIELRGTQRILGRDVQTRSVHVFRSGEYVFEANAPASVFPIADKQVLDPLLKSLRFRPLSGNA